MTQKGGSLLSNLTGLAVPAALVLARDFLSKRNKKSTRKNRRKQKGGARRYPGVALGGKRSTRRMAHKGGSKRTRKMHHPVAAYGAVAALFGLNEVANRKQRKTRSRRNRRK